MQRPVKWPVETNRAVYICKLDDRWQAYLFEVGRDRPKEERYRSEGL